MPSWTLFDPQARPSLENLDQQTILLVPGGYPEAGVNHGEDSSRPALAMRYWYKQMNPLDGRQRQMTGGERHAYRLHHFVNQRLVIPIPDLWLILIAAALGKGVSLQWHQRQKRQGPISLWPWLKWGLGGSMAYALMSLELYMSSLAILIPIGLPLLMFWIYLVPIARKGYRD